MVSKKSKRFEIWLVRLNPTVGREIKKTRPCVIVSPDEIMSLATVLVAPMTTKGFNLPCRLPYEFKQKQGLILLDQIRSVDKARLVKKLGTLDDKEQFKLCDLLQRLFSY